MKPTLSLAVLMALLFPIPVVVSAQDRLAATGKEGDLIALERKLIGLWKGPACGGDYTFRPDGTFELQHFTPGNNTLTGTWAVRWDALPPTLILTCKTSDIRKKNPERTEYAHLGKPLETKLLELDGESLVYRLPGDEEERRFRRRDEK